MTKKLPRKDLEVVDVPADDPEGTMKRFTRGLRRVLTVPKRTVVGGKLRRPRKKRA